MTKKLICILLIALLCAPLRVSCSQDSDVPDGEDFWVQEYTIHVLPAIYPDASLSFAAAKEKMKKENYEAWVKVYEDFYGKPLAYGEG